MASTSFPSFCPECNSDADIFFTNYTNETTIFPVGQELRSLTEVIILLCILLTICFLALGGNAAVIAAIFIDEDLREQVSNIFIISLAVTDLLASVLVMLPTAGSIIADEWILGKVGCDLHCHANYSLTTISYLTLMLISMDRMEAVLHPLHYSSRVTRHRVGFAVTFIWVYIFLWVLVPVFNNWIEYDYWEVNCGIDWALPDCHWWIWVSVVTYFIPSFSVIIVSSGIILRSAEKSSKNLQIPAESHDKSKKESDSSTSNKKLMKSLFVLIITFNVCVTPFVVVRVSKMMAGLGSELLQNAILRRISTYSTFSQYAASATNPFIYAIFRKDFRNAFRKVFKSISRKIYPL